MGEHLVKKINNKENRAEFIKHLLDDVKALELMLKQNLIEDDIIRIGAEQEFCLITDSWRPAKNAEKILNAINDPHFTTELAKYNLEINLDPLKLEGNCFTEVESQLKTLLKKAAITADKYDTKVLLTGILPTITKNELSFEYMTPSPRYWALNEKLKEIRGTDFKLHLRGVDELTIYHDSVLFEGCNTSFQMHLQVPPKDFISSYNWAQAISAPILGISTNSPLLLGRELWNETRIALFRQSLDTRSSSYALKDQQARVSFGDNWSSESIVDVYKNDIVNHKIIIAKDIKANSLDELKEGVIPKLSALALHNGTIYRWNRPCYGVGGGKPHIRIENRYIPSGPTIQDEIANFALWAGIMMGRPSKYDDLSICMDFKDAKSNFVKTARMGKDTILSWMGNHISVQDLIIKELLPIAYSGLKRMQIDKEDIERLLKIIENRTKGTSGSQWQIKNYRWLRNTMKQDDALRALTKAMYQNQQNEFTIPEWPDLKTKPEINEASHLVGHIMSTRLFTVNKNDIANLATSIMKWKNIHHVPVENNSGELCGLLTWTHVERQQKLSHNGNEKIVADIMVKEVITVQPGTTIKAAISIMKKHEIGCLPVTQSDDLVGIITIKDVIEFDNGKSV
ncbi:CBS domain-containing protein [Aquimarina sp. MMG016]|uniref:CBS domain-containing protein n=1 Tax=Aquimarina sp. MMG016 TaxID=2822690 RepID=UPI001B39F855|nr:CBS domain-containing protein [Aquimarina sp. MMG016]MBQ4821036.1 CBS domain-containing protein [Aquimarina sp. MMG016]